MSESVRPSRRGMVLVFVLVVVALLSLAALTFSDLMMAERSAAHLSGRRVQAMAVAASGLEAARMIISQDKETQDDAGGWYDNSNQFQEVIIGNDEDVDASGRYTVLARAMHDGRPAGVRFGLEDESSRLNLNALLSTAGQDETQPRQRLMALPGMTESIADSILDWIDTDEQPRQYGAEAEYYTRLDPPYRPKNGPLATVEELLLVRDVTPGLLFGADANRNGFVDAHEPDPQALGDFDNRDGSMNGGWASYLTLHSLQKNAKPDGTSKIHLNQDDMRPLKKELATVLPDDWASFIVAYRQHGPSQTTQPGVSIGGGQIDLSKPATTKIKSVLDLVDARVQLKFQGSNESTVVKSPFANSADKMKEYLPKLLDHVTVDEGATQPGRVNINQASRVVLASIPGMTEEMIGRIVYQRQPDPREADPARRHATWILIEGIVDLDAMKALMPHVCAEGSVFRGQAVGYFSRPGPSARIEFLLNATQRPALVVFWRDISHLGRGYMPVTLGIEVP